MGYEVGLELGLAEPVFLGILLVAVVILLHILLVPLSILYFAGLFLADVWDQWKRRREGRQEHR